VTTGADLLQAIVASVRASLDARALVVPRDELERRAAARAPRAELFREALAGGAAPRIIAECKRRSPSRGLLQPRYDAAAIASGYAAAGAAAISVLTEPAFFDGDLAHLEAVRAAVDLPVLHKDFVVDEYQVLEARAAGADAVLLIVAALDGRALADLLAACARHGLAALVEVHDATELGRALGAGADVIGVNQRNLRSLDVSASRALELVASIPDWCVAVAESGLRTGAEVARLSRAGFDAFLVGERLMAAASPGEALTGLLADARAALSAEER
jgi:indole-3-glycerol phosphate synthase